MEIIGGIASVTQLAVYTHTAWRVFTRLYVELKGGPVGWQEHVTNLQLLIQITKRISDLPEKTQINATGQISKLLCELQVIAQEALDTIGKARVKVLGVCWSAVGVTKVLDRAFDSLRTKREFLLLILSHEQLIELASVGKILSRSQIHTEDHKTGGNVPAKGFETIEMGPKVRQQSNNRVICL